MYIYVYAIAVKIIIKSQYTQVGRRPMATDTTSTNIRYYFITTRRFYSEQLGVTYACVGLIQNRDKIFQLLFLNKNFVVKTDY